MTNAAQTLANLADNQAITEMAAAKDATLLASVGLTVAQCTKNIITQAYLINRNALAALAVRYGARDAVAKPAKPVISQKGQKGHGKPKRFKIYGHSVSSVLRWCGANGWTVEEAATMVDSFCLLYTSPSPRDRQKSRMPSSA